MVEEHYDDVITALTIYREMGGQPSDWMNRVYYVIRNRMADPRWPDRAAAICLQAHQFSCWNPNDPTFQKVPLPDDAEFLKTCRAMVDDGPDPTNGANHYHSYRPGHPDWPSWATNEKLVGSFHRTDTAGRNWYLHLYRL